MRNPLRTAFAVIALAGGLAAAPALYAQDQQAPGSMMGQEGMRGEEGMMGEGEMMPMMNMMQQMSRMMTNCNKMMESMMDESGDRPNEQFRNGDSPAPEQRG
jgi:hypothetical protein